MPIGMCNATATFQRMMAQSLTRITKKYGNLVICYVDDMEDVVIATSTLAGHIDRRDEVLDCMKRAGLKCKPSKCEILRDSIKYLGRMVDRHGVSRANKEGPHTNTQLKNFLRFANYYREFKKRYADKLYPLRQCAQSEEVRME